MSRPVLPCFFLCPDLPVRDLYRDLYAAPGGAGVDVRIPTPVESGVDLRFPADIEIPPTRGLPTIIDLGVRARCEAAKPVVVFGDRAPPTHVYSAYWLVPRSSIAKTPLGLANSVGLIDSGYTGTLKVAIRNFSDEPFTVRRGSSLFQIALPDLKPASLIVVDETHKAFAPTARGGGGFGSTGGSGVGLGPT